MNKLGGLKILVALPVLLAIAGCSGRQSADRAAVDIRGSNPSAPSAQAAAPANMGGLPANGPGTSAEGIINYDSYQAAIARSGDTVASVADRIGLSASELGAYNGLTPDHALRAGDELVLPQRPGGYSSAPTQPSSTFVPQGNPPGGNSIVATPLDGSGTTAVAEAPGAPAATWSPDVAAAAINRSSTFDSNRNLTPPPSSSEPLPPSPAAPGILQPPNLGQYQTPGPQPIARPVETLSTPQEQVIEPQVAMAEPARPANSGSTSGLHLIPPVQGTIVIGFQRGAGRSRNDGIDYAAPANSAVVAAADGEVALVSQSLGGLGTIVLVRHPGEYLTVYGRIEGVNVVKGDLVRRGQKIGIVAPTIEPRMHFEVRKGAESLDPEQFF